jgi:cold-inducible RNA-binding protein
MEQENKLYVGNFPFSWKEEDLENAFSEFRDNIVDIKIIYDQYSKRSKGFAFVTFDDSEIAKRALSKSQTTAGDRTLVVSIARPPAPRGSFERNDRGPRNGGGGSGGRSDRGSRNGGGYGRSRNDFDD